MPTEPDDVLVVLEVMDQQWPGYQTAKNIIRKEIEQLRHDLALVRGAFLVDEPAASLYDMRKSLDKMTEQRNEADAILYYIYLNCLGSTDFNFTPEETERIMRYAHKYYPEA